MKLSSELWYYVNHVSNKVRKDIRVEPTMMPFISPSCADVVNNPDSKVHGAYMGPTWGRQDPSGPHVGLMNFAIREDLVPW